MSMLWRQTHFMDPKAVALADRHYSRKTPGSAGFLEPGYRLVFVLPGYRGLWASHTGRLDTPRRDGRDIWSCAIFRNESNRLATVLIRQAIAATRYLWRHRPLPTDGFMTFIDEGRVQPPPDGLPYGWTFIAAGFMPIGYTKVHHLLILQLPRARLALVEPRPVPLLGGGEQQRLEFGA